jgi:hypothetical protein
MVVSSTFYAADVSLNNPVTILNVTLDISKSRRSVKQIKEFKPFLIRNDVEEISFMAFDEGEKIINIGYESGNEVIPGLINYLQSRGISPKQASLEEFDTTKEMHDNWQILKTRLNQTNLPVKETGWSIKPGLEPWHSFGNTHYLNQNYFPTIKSSLWYDRSLLEGMLFYSDGLTGSIMRLEMGINSFLYINVEGQLKFSAVTDNLLQYNGNYIFSETGAILPFPGGFIEPGIISEFIDIEDPEKSKFFLRPGIKFKSGSSNLVLDFRYLIRRDKGNDTYGLSAEYISSIPVGYGFTLDTRAYGKGALINSSTGVELTFNDYYRSRGSTIISTLYDYFPSYLILNGNITWNVGRYMSTIGEILTLKDSTLYLFCDLLVTDLFNYNGNTEVNPTVGVGANLETSFIGLKPYIFSLSGGWDLNAALPFITFSIGTVFN